MPNWKTFLHTHLDLPEMTRHLDQRAVDEMADHLEDIYQEALARGSTEEQAMALVREWIGDPEEAAKDILSAEPNRLRARANRWAEGGEERMRQRGGALAGVADVLRDLRAAARALARQPVFTGVVVLVVIRLRTTASPMPASVLPGTSRTSQKTVSLKIWGCSHLDP